MSNNIHKSIVLRTNENDPQCLRTEVFFLIERKFSMRLADAIYRYYESIGDWPTIDQVQNAINRYREDQK